MSPDALEAFKVGADHIAATGLAQVEHRGATSGNAVEVLANEELLVGAVDGVVQDSLMHPDFGCAVLAQE